MRSLIMSPRDVARNKRGEAYICHPANHHGKKGADLGLPRRPATGFPCALCFSGGAGLRRIRANHAAGMPKPVIARSESDEAIQAILAVVLWIASLRSQRRRRWRLSDRRRVLNAAGIPELVQAARDVQARLGSDVTLIDLAVIADMLDDAHGPVLAEAEVGTVSAFVADEPHDVRLLRFQG